MCVFNRPVRHTTPAGDRSTHVEYSPLRARSSSWVPSSCTPPPLSTAILSELRMVVSRWATVRVVRFCCACSWSRASCTCEERFRPRKHPSTGASCTMHPKLTLHPRLTRNQDPANADTIPTKWECTGKRTRLLRGNPAIGIFPLG